jgi:hypothetical protein
MASAVRRTGPGQSPFTRSCHLEEKPQQPVLWIADAKLLTLRGWHRLLATCAAQPQEVIVVNLQLLLSLRDTGCKQPVPTWNSRIQETSSGFMPPPADHSRPTI